WKYVGFDFFKLKSGQILKKETGSREVCLVLVSGKASIKTLHDSWDNLGERMSIFPENSGTDSKPPYAVYIPNDDQFSVAAETELELAVCSAPGKGSFPARLIKPEHMTCETRGQGTNTRHICNILPETAEADNLLVVEVITPNGNWSSYPPHKHDSDNIPEESYLEETYYHRINPQQGFAFQRVYTDDGSLDETMAVHNHDVVMVPRGYHPVGAPHGYDLYYLNVMAGPKRVWRFHNDPRHEWIVKKTE
ncbi:MAG: 5-deoxy-glucuronate isomerase, partial [SAR324 cluster bacterium]|nr:5-deoxy-glucuronate isomerase [SAR324 cluster bacterium]